ncbi:MAG: hypothetical protein ACI4FZ_05860 [Lachnospiraceae bacterium]
MRKQVKNIALGLAASMLVSMAAPAMQTAYAGTEVYSVTLGTAEQRSMTEATLEVGETIDLNFYGVKDWGKNKQNYQCKWSVDGDSVTVNGWGVVTAVKGGTAVVSLSIKDTVTGISHDVKSTEFTVIAEEVAEPTTEPTEEPTEAPVFENAEFAAVLRELHSLETYEERETYIETLDKSRYEVKAADNADLITHENGEYTDIIKTYNYETNDYIVTIAPDSGIHYPSICWWTLRGLASLVLPDESEIDELINGWVGDGYREAGYSESEIRDMAVIECTRARYFDTTGKYDFMTITDTTTGETDPWGVKVYMYNYSTYYGTDEIEYAYKDGKIEHFDETPLRVDEFESEVLTVYHIIEDLVDEHNADRFYLNGNLWYGNVTVVEPVCVEEMYDENWEPTGEYYFYDEDYNEVPVKDSGYTVVDNWYLADADGNLIMHTYEHGWETMDPYITKWETLKYYSDIYTPRTEFEW